MLFFCAAAVFLMFEVPYENALVVCSLLTPLLGALLVPELARSFSEGMWEMEQVCFYNLGEIMAFKMVILGGVSGVLIAFGAAATRMETGSFLDFELWICLPFLAVSSLSFFCFGKSGTDRQSTGLLESTLWQQGSLSVCGARKKIFTV